MVESGHLGLTLLTSIPRLLVLRWRHVADGLEQPAVVEPVDPFERRVLDAVDVPPRASAANDLSLVQTVARLGERVVVRVADASDRRLDTCLREPCDRAARDIEPFAL